MEKEQQTQAEILAFYRSSVTVLQESTATNTRDIREVKNKLQQVTALPETSAPQNVDIRRLETTGTTNTGDIKSLQQDVEGLRQEMKKLREDGLLKSATIDKLQKELSTLTASSIPVRMGEIGSKSKGRRDMKDMGDDENNEYENLAPPVRGQKRPTSITTLDRQPNRKRQHLEEEHRREASPQLPLTYSPSSSDESEIVFLRSNTVLVDHPLNENGEQSDPRSQMTLADNDEYVPGPPGTWKTFHIAEQSDTETTKAKLFGDQKDIPEAVMNMLVNADNDKTTQTHRVKTANTYTDRPTQCWMTKHKTYHNWEKDDIRPKGRYKEPENIAFYTRHWPDWQDSECPSCVARKAAGERNIWCFHFKTTTELGIFFPD